MSGTFTAGEQKTRPGSYFRYKNSGLPASVAVTNDVVACVVQSNWGPLGKVVEIEQDDHIFGSSGTAEIINLIRQQGARCKVVRLGDGESGVAGTITLKDTTAEDAVDAVKLTAKYVGSRDIRVALRDSLSDSTKRELLVYDGTTFKKRILFAKGNTGDGEPAALTAAVNAGNDWLTATKSADGNKTLAAVSATALTGGANPTITTTDYSAAFALIEAVQFNVICVDTEDVAVHALVDVFIDRIWDDGKLGLYVIGEPTSIPFDDRCENSAAYNDFKGHYLLNGYTDISGNLYEGYKAAAIIAGLIAATGNDQGITHAVMSRAKGVSEALTNSQIIKAINSGALIFTENAQGQVQVEYGVNTLVTLGPDEDAGWKKIRRVRTRIELINRIDAQTEPLVGKVNNDPDGRSTFIATAQREINSMAAEGKLLTGGAIAIDPDNPPAGDSSWYVIAVDDIDSGEKFYFTYKFRFAPES